MVEDSRVLITGATSYVGRRLVRKLLVEGYEPWALARKASSQDLLGDLGINVASWTDFPKASRLVHLATLYSGQTEPGQSIKMFESNVSSPRGLIEAFLGQGGTRVVCAGTCWEDCGGSRTPANFYAATKASFRVLASTMMAEAKGELFWLRFSDIVGDDDARSRLFVSLKDGMEKGLPMPMTLGSQPFDPVWVGDAERALIGSLNASVDRGGYFGDFGISGGDPKSLREKVQAILEKCGKEGLVQCGMKNYRHGEPFMVNWREGPAWWRPEVDYAGVIDRIFS